MLIDTHCHIDASEFDGDRELVLQRAAIAGVEKLVVPAVEASGFEKLLEICATRQQCRPALGIHPLYVGAARGNDLELLEQAIARQRPVAIGEIGLDFLVPNFDRETQLHFFEAQLRLARKYDLPALLHVRRSQDAVLSSLRRIRVKGGIAHAFNGSPQQANEFVKLGFRLGMGGAMTYDRALRIRKLAANLPLSSLVLETDSPDMPPAFAPKDRNEPANLPKIAEILAQLRGISPAEIAAATSYNATQILELK